jgi:hypothetical protein
MSSFNHKSRSASDCGGGVFTPFSPFATLFPGCTKGPGSIPVPAPSSEDPSTERQRASKIENKVGLLLHISIESKII